MKLKDLLKIVSCSLSEAHIDESSIESELLLRHALSLRPVDLYLGYDKELKVEEEENIRQLMQRRLIGEPSAYIIERREFYGLDYYVNASVLIPRPETELLIEKTLHLARSHVYPVIADVGTGSGVIAVSLARMIPESKIYAVDVSSAALGVANTNACQYGVSNRITFFHGDLLKPLPDAVDIIVANLPYVRSEEVKESYEPRLALDGGKYGLDVITRLCHQLPGKLNHGGSVLLEVGMGQAEIIVTILEAALTDAVIGVSQDLAGIDRMVYATIPATLAG
jgi:release factor glutamine methyltransferase